MAGAEKRGLLAAYRRLLRPLVRILMRNGVAFAELAEVAKLVYVEVAESEFQVPHRKMSQARIAILTGLTRKEVSRVINKSKSGDYDLHSNLNRVTRVLTGWHTDPQFTGPYGLPLELQFEEPGEADVLKLVQKYSGDMAARAMLDELIRVKAVQEMDGGWYKVLTRTYLPEVDAPDSLDRLAKSVSNFIGTLDYNRQENDPDQRLFERIVFADNGIRPEDLPLFKDYIREKAQLLLEDIDNWLSKLEPPDEEKSDAISTGLGVFHYVDYDEEEDREIDLEQ